MDSTLPDHWPLSPSGSYRWLRCAHSKTAPPSPPNAAAAAGTIGHKACEPVLRSGKADYIDLLLLEDTVFAGARQLVARRDADAIADATAAYVAEVASQPGVPLVELKIQHADIPEFGGTMDALFVRDDYLEIFDLKTGEWDAHHEQLACYAALANQEYPRPIVHAIIIQPRAVGRKRQVHFWTSDELARFEGRVRKAAASDDVVAGDHCRFCTLRPTCLPGREFARQQGW